MVKFVVKFVTAGALSKLAIKDEDCVSPMSGCVRVSVVYKSCLVGKVHALTKSLEPGAWSLEPKVVFSLESGVWSLEPADIFFAIEILKVELVFKAEEFKIEVLKVEVFKVEVLSKDNLES